MSVIKPLSYFCPACQAFPQAGYCRLAGCPTAPGEGPPSRSLSAPQQVFAVRLAQARRGLEMSQEEVSKRSGLPASAVSHYESGRRSPSLDNLVRLIRAMPGVNANWLLGLTAEVMTSDYEDGYSDALRDTQEALTELEQRSFAREHSSPPSSERSSPGRPQDKADQ